MTKEEYISQMRELEDMATNLFAQIGDDIDAYDNVINKIGQRQKELTDEYNKNKDR